MNGLDRKYEDIKRIKGARWLLLLVMLTQLVINVLSSAIVSFLPSPSEGFARYAEYIELGIITILTFLIPIGVYGIAFWRKTERDNASEMRLNGFSGKLTGLIVLMAISGQFVMALLNMPFSSFAAQSTKALTPVTLSEAAVAIVVTAVLPGILEEFWMRGIILSVYERRSTFCAIFFTTIMFALLHKSPAKLPGTLFMGFVAAIITIRANSVYAAMLYHILSNATAVVFGFIAANYKIGDMFLWTFLCGTVLIFAASFICFLAVSPKRKRQKCPNEGAMLLKNFLSIPVILCLVIVFLKIKFGA